MADTISGCRPHILHSTQAISRRTNTDNYSTHARASRCIDVLQPTQPITCRKIRRHPKLHPPFCVTQRYSTHVHSTQTVAHRPHTQVYSPQPISYSTTVEFYSTHAVSMRDYTYANTPSRVLSRLIDIVQSTHRISPSHDTQYHSTHTTFKRLHSKL